MTGELRYYGQRSVEIDALRASFAEIKAKLQSVEQHEASPPPSSQTTGGVSHESVDSGGAEDLNSESPQEPVSQQKGTNTQTADVWPAASGPQNQSMHSGMGMKYARAPLVENWRQREEQQRARQPDEKYTPLHATTWVRSSPPLMMPSNIGGADHSDLRVSRAHRGPDAALQSAGQVKLSDGVKEASSDNNAQLPIKEGQGALAHVPESLRMRLPRYIASRPLLHEQPEGFHKNVPVPLQPAKRVPDSFTTPVKEGRPESWQGPGEGALMDGLHDVAWKWASSHGMTDTTDFLLDGMWRKNEQPQRAAQPNARTTPPHGLSWRNSNLPSMMSLSMAGLEGGMQQPGADLRDFRGMHLRQDMDMEPQSSWNTVRPDLLMDAFSSNETQVNTEGHSPNYQASVLTPVSDHESVVTPMPADKGSKPLSRRQPEGLRGPRPGPARTAWPSPAAALPLGMAAGPDGQRLNLKNQPTKIMQTFAQNTGGLPEYQPGPRSNSTCHFDLLPEGQQMVDDKSRFHSQQPLTLGHLMQFEVSGPFRL